MIAAPKMIEHTVATLVGQPVFKCGRSHFARRFVWF